MNVIARTGAALTVALGLALSAKAGTAPEAVTAPVRPPADPVAELKNGDSAFSLLIECYRQLQLSLIEIEYEHRLDAADKTTDSAAREQAQSEANRNAEERVHKLGVDLENMVAAYHSSRLKGEREAGVRVPHQVDRYQAAQTLRGYVAFVPPDDGESPAIRLTPRSATDPLP